MTHAKEGYSVPAKSHASPADGEAALSDHDSHRLATLRPRYRHRGQALSRIPLHKGALIVTLVMNEKAQYDELQIARKRSSLTVISCNKLLVFINKISQATIINSIV
jgi:hypothetical protein